jgi:tetratricopeptide (TPR) repeat protein
MATQAETFALAQQHHRAGRLQQAEQMYRGLLDAGSSDPAVWCHLGAVQIALGQPAQAEASYRQALALRPDLAEAHANLGFAQARQGRPDEAAASIRQALRLRPHYPEASCNLGAILHQLGRPGEAVACLQEALRLRPDFAEAYNHLGLVYLSQSRPAEAAACFRQALALEPQSEEVRRHLEAALRSQTAAPAPPVSADDPARACNVRGIDLSREGRWEEAVASFREAVRLRPDYADAFNNLGNVLFFQKQFDEAIAAYEQAVRLAPGHAGYHSNLGEVLRHRGRLAEALGHCRRAVELRPDSAAAQHHLGLALAADEQFEEAAARCALATRLDPGRASAHLGLGYALLWLRRTDEAVAALGTALQLKPDLAEAHSTLGTALLRQGKLEEALARFEEALRLQPDLADASVHKAHALWQLGDFEQAVACAAAVVDRDPECAEGYNALGLVQMKAGRLAEAVAAFDRAVAIKPDFAQAHVNRALSWLLQGDYERGWPEYEWRWRCRDYAARPPAGRVWDGSPLAGRTILLQAEQGVGDTLDFVRFAPALKQQGATVILACPPALMSLLGRCQGIDQVVDQNAVAVPYDPACRPSVLVEAPLLSLPGKLGTSLSTVPAAVPYLFGDPALEEHGRRELKRLPGLKVGIAWQGNPDYAEDRLRSVPLACFAPLARDGVRLISLQRGAGSEQLEALAGRFPVEELPACPEGVSPTLWDAAVIKGLDLVVSVDSAVAHLAGGLGVPVWIALGFAPHWRWLLGREDSPWYPSARLFRQERFGDWDGVFAAMARALDRLRGQAG